MIFVFGSKAYDYSRPEKEVENSAAYFKQHQIRNVLDLGCGNGRHVHYLRQQGFNAYGVDKMLPETQEQGFAIADMHYLPFRNASFEGIIANQVIYHGTKKDMEKAISEMYRVLQRKGLFFVTLQPRENQEWRMGQKLEDWTYVASAGPDKGEIHHFVDEQEITELFGRTNLIKVYRDARNDWCILGSLNQ